MVDKYSKINFSAKLNSFHIIRKKNPVNNGVQIYLSYVEIFRPVL